MMTSPYRRSAPFQDPYDGWSPGRKVMEAQKRMQAVQAERSRCDTPARHDWVSVAQQHLNAQAELLPCPEGFGDGACSRHWCPPVGDECVRCIAPVVDILTRASQCALDLDGVS